MYDHEVASGAEAVQQVRVNSLGLGFLSAGNSNLTARTNGGWKKSERTRKSGRMREARDDIADRDKVVSRTAEYFGGVRGYAVDLVALDSMLGICEEE